MSPTSSSTGYLNATAAYNLDQDLFKSFSLEQLMELAGLSVAQAVHEVLAPKGSGNPEGKKVLILCGPGNNGGDGLVAARHLQLFGYKVQTLYPKQSKKEPHYSRLVDQCQDVGVEFINEMPNVEEVGDGLGIVDALFGFSFRGEIREPFGEILHRVMDIQEYKKEKVKVISVDVPSGWNVDDGDVSGLGFTPDGLISLTAPKLCSTTFMGRHFVGGRFLPSKLAEKYDIQMPGYSGSDQIIELSPLSTGQLIVSTRAPQSEDESNTDWGAVYAAHCAEKEAEKDRSKEDIVEQWALDYYDYMKEKDKERTESNQGTEVEDWALEYDKYLKEDGHGKSPEEK